MAGADGLHRVAAVAARRAVHRRLAGPGKPASGAGISKALESGLAAGDARSPRCDGAPDGFTDYAQRMEAAWGREDKRGRYFHKLAGIPAVANNGIKLIDNAFFRNRMLKSLYKKEQGPQHKYK